MMTPVQRLLRVGVLAAALSCGAVLVQGAEVIHFRVEDTIQPASQRFIERVLGEAEARSSSVVVMELDTPGGLLDATREITSAITNSRVPVVVYVAPAGARAASAGFFILMSADVAAMAHGTNTGASHPVGGQGENLPEDVREKATNDASAMIRALVERRHRNLDLAQEAVEKSTSFTAEEALKGGLIDLVADSLDGLIKALDGREIVRFDGSKEVLDVASPVIVNIEPSFADRLFSVLANPNVAYLLMALGALGLYVEITHPGGILPGVVGVVFLLLGLYSISVLPVSWAGVALIFVGLFLFILEVKVTSYGMLTIGGLICFILGSLMLFETPIPAMRVSLSVVVPTALVVAGVTGFLLSRVVKAHRKQVLTGEQGMVGEIGRTLTELVPEGKVLVHGEYWDARARAATIPAGTAVRVLAVRQRRIEVEPSDATDEGSES